MATSNTLGKLREIAESDDPKAALMAEVGDLNDVEVLHCQVLVATYSGTKFHSGTKILRSDRSLQENIYQGSVGLVLKMGPGAFEDTPSVKFYGKHCKVGDWVLYRPSDGISLTMKQVPCRLFNDVDIKMVVSDPEKFW